MNRDRFWKIVSFGLLAVAIALAARSFVAIYLASVNVIWSDQWIMIAELQQFREGRTGLGYLWLTYWGHRIVIPRLVFLLDERLFRFSNYPLIAFSVLCQIFTCLVLCRLQWRALAQTSSLSKKVAAVALTTYLLFSSLQAENFVYGMLFQNALCYALSITALVFLSRSLGSAQQRSLALPASIVFALLASFTMIAGLLVWPAMMLESILFRATRRKTLTIAFLSVATFGLYFVKYSRVPELGMGFGGVLANPGGALQIGMLFLGGPISLDSVNGAEWAGFLGAVMAVFFAVRSLLHSRTRTHVDPVLISVCFLVILIALCSSIGRISPEWMAGKDTNLILPSRYITPGFVFWSCLGTIALSAWGTNQSNSVAAIIALASAALVVACAIKNESVVANVWHDFCHEKDAVSSALVMGINDEERLSMILSEPKRLAPWVEYLKLHRLSFFSEQRGTLAGHSVLNLQQNQEYSLALGAIDTTSKTQDGFWRVDGHVPDADITRARDVIIEGNNGTVVGLGRTLCIRDPNNPALQLFWGFSRVNNPGIRAFEVNKR